MRAPKSLTTRETRPRIVTNFMTVTNSVTSSACGLSCCGSVLLLENLGAGNLALYRQCIDSVYRHIVYRVDCRSVLRRKEAAFPFGAPPPRLGCCKINSPRF